MMHYAVRIKPRYGTWVDSGEYLESTAAKSAANNYSFTHPGHKARVVKVIEEVIYET